MFLIYGPLSLGHLCRKNSIKYLKAIQLIKTETLFYVTSVWDSGSNQNTPAIYLFIRIYFFLTWEVKIPQKSDLLENATEFESRDRGTYGGSAAREPPSCRLSGVAHTRHTQPITSTPLMFIWRKAERFWFYSQAFDLAPRVCWQPFNTTHHIQILANQAQVAQGTGGSVYDKRVSSSRQ